MGGRASELMVAVKRLLMTLMSTGSDEGNALRKGFALESIKPELNRYLCWNKPRETGMRTDSLQDHGLRKARQASFKDER